MRVFNQGRPESRWSDRPVVLADAHTDFAAPNSVAPALNTPSPQSAGIEEPQRFRTRFLGLMRLLVLVYSRLGSVASVGARCTRQAVANARIPYRVGRVGASVSGLCRLRVRWHAPLARSFGDTQRSMRNSARGRTRTGVRVGAVDEPWPAFFVETAVISARPPSLSGMREERDVSPDSGAAS